jgi:hypothetical protein
VCSAALACQEGGSVSEHHPFLKPAEPSYTGTVSGHEVPEGAEWIGCHPKHTDYPLLPGDLLIARKDGTFYKFGPGLGIEGFRLTEEQRLALKPVIHQRFGMGGLSYFLDGGA